LTTISATAVMARHTSFRVKLWAESRLKYLRISVNFRDVHSRLSQVVADDVHPSLFIHFIFHLLLVWAAVSIDCLRWHAHRPYRVR